MVKRKGLESSDDGVCGKAVPVGNVVVLSSVSAKRGGLVFGAVAFPLPRRAQLGFARALAREVGPYGVTVNPMAPGPIDTDVPGSYLETSGRPSAGSARGASRRHRR
jgi:NAD(P)-dependent dehydrogenase (short-subunit alcohol dehydrogenase family)